MRAAGGGSAASLRGILSGSAVVPLPFSFHRKVDVGGAKATLRLGSPYTRFCAREGRAVACDWSQAFSLGLLAGDRARTLVGDGFSVDVVVSVGLGEGALRCTRMVSILPRFVICNKLQRPLELCQVGAEHAKTAQLAAGDLHVLRLICLHVRAPHARARAHTHTHTHTHTGVRAGGMTRVRCAPCACDCFPTPAWATLTGAGSGAGPCRLKRLDTAR